MINQERVQILTQLRSHQPLVQLITTRDIYKNIMMLADINVIKMLLKRQLQKPISSILSKKYDLKVLSSIIEDIIVFASFEAEEFLVDFSNGG